MGLFSILFNLLMERMIIGTGVDDRESCETGRVIDFLDTVDTKVDNIVPNGGRQNGDISGEAEQGLKFLESDLPAADNEDLFVGNI